MKVASCFRIGTLCFALPLAVLARPLGIEAADSQIDSFTALEIYDGVWAIRTMHPWNGAPPDTTVSCKVAVIASGCILPASKR